MSDISRLNQWYALNLRCTAFLLEPVTEATTWWKDIVAELPEQTQFRPKEITFTDEGNFEKGRLVLKISPGRVDWLYSIDNDKIEKQPFSEQKKFYELVNNWLDIAPSIKRIAFGAVLLQPTENREEGYKELSKYLTSVKLDHANSSDFLYRINRPRVSSEIEGLDINRLSKWSIAKHQTFLQEANQDKNIALNANPKLDSYSCHLELDISTSAFHTAAIPKDNISQVFNELVSFGNEIASDGDVK